MLIGKTLDDVNVDTLEFTPFGRVLLSGWSDASELAVEDFQFLVDGVASPASEFYRVYRPDVRNGGYSERSFTGFVVEFPLGVRAAGTTRQCELRLFGQSLFRGPVPREPIPVHYDYLLSHDEVEPRDRIYGVGAPLEAIPEEILLLLDETVRGGKTLDFGCGRGNLVSTLVARGIDAHGIEIDRSAIRTHLLPHVADRITLYDGTFPLPYENAAFDTVTAVEVIEHVPDFEAAVAEIRRVCRSRFVMTVPDASAIPRCYAKNVVPWHMLESTHLNFFTLASATKLLSRYWPRIRTFKLARTQVDDVYFHNSIVCVCDD